MNFAATLMISLAPPRLVGRHRNQRARHAACNARTASLSLFLMQYSDRNFMAMILLCMVYWQRGEGRLSEKSRL